MSQGREELHYVPLIFMITQSMLIIKIMCIGIPLKVLCNKLFLVKGSMLFFSYKEKLLYSSLYFLTFCEAAQPLQLILKLYCLDFFSPSSCTALPVEPHHICTTLTLHTTWGPV